MLSGISSLTELYIIYLYPRQKLTKIMIISYLGSKSEETIKIKCIPE